MKIALSATGNSLESNLDLRFGRCNYFIIYDSEDGSVDVRENRGRVSTGGAGIAAAQQLIDEEVDVVITGHLGPNAFNLLNSAGIKAYTCESISVKSALKKYEDGKLVMIREAGESYTGMGRGFKGGR